MGTGGRDYIILYSIQICVQILQLGKGQVSLPRMMKPRRSDRCKTCKVHVVQQTIVGSSFLLGAQRVSTS